MATFNGKVSKLKYQDNTGRWTYLDPLDADYNIHDSKSMLGIVKSINPDGTVNVILSGNTMHPSLVKSFTLKGNYNVGDVVPSSEIYEAVSTPQAIPVKPLSAYDLLNLPPSASPADIKSAYRRMVKLHHPDAGGDRDTFEDIQKAYKLLSDPKSRKKYDAIRKLTEKKSDELEDESSVFTSNWLNNLANMTWNTRSAGRMGFQGSSATPPYPPNTSSRYLSNIIFLQSNPTDFIKSFTISSGGYNGPAAVYDTLELTIDIPLENSPNAHIYYNPIGDELFIKGLAVGVVIDVKQPVSRFDINTHITVRF